MDSPTRSLRASGSLTVPQRTRHLLQPPHRYDRRRLQLLHQPVEFVDRRVELALMRLPQLLQRRYPRLHLRPDNPALA